MKMIQHGENLWQLTRLFVFNCYLVREADGLTLVDTSIPGSANDILQAAQQIGLPITRVTVTHAHGDHVGSLEAVGAQLAGAEIALAARSADFLQGNTDLRAGEPQVKLRGGYVKLDLRPTRLLAPGDRVGSLRVVASPGHSPDHIAFLDERDGTLLAGDAFQTQGGIAVAGVLRWRFPLPAMATWHLPTALESAIALRALAPTRLAVGHGRVLDAPLAQMDEAIRQAEAKSRG